MSDASTKPDRMPSAVVLAGPVASAHSPLNASGDADPAIVVSPRQRRRRSSARRASLYVNGGLPVFLVILILGFSFAKPSEFPTWANTRVILDTQAIPLMLALAVTIPLLAGEFDLSVAATLGLTSVFTAYAISHGLSAPLALLLALAIGAVIGLVNGLLVTKIGLNAFIATLGMSTLLSGGNILISNNAVIFQNIRPSFRHIGTAQWFGIPAVSVYAVVLALILWYLLEWTPFGRYLRATGQGRAAARLSGIRTDGWLLTSFILAALIAALCGYLLTAQIGSATPGVGPSYLLPAYAGAFLGATTIHAGRFNVWGTVIGVLVLAVGIAGLNLFGLSAWVSPVFNGGALIIAVSVSLIVARRSSQRT